MKLHHVREGCVNVILEGPDGAGKSTLATALARALPAMQVRHGLMEGYTGYHLAEQAMHALAPAYYGAGTVVQDRSWLSERIYAKVFRDGDDRFYGLASMLRRVLMATDHLVVRLSSPVDVLWKTVGDRPAEELAKKREQLERVCVLYESLPDENRGVQFVTLDARAQDAAKNVEFVKTNLELSYRRDDKERWRAYGMVGNLDRLARAAKLPVHKRAILLVGDRPNDTSTGLPFVDFASGGCSTWLAAKLKEVVDEEQLVWLNARGHDGEPQPFLGELLDELLADGGSCSGLVALGREAANALQDLGYGVRGVEHPQYLRRFHHHRPLAESDLGGAIRHLLEERKPQKNPMAELLALAGEPTWGRTPS